jgi:hypothetical protein
MRKNYQKKQLIIGLVLIGCLTGLSPVKLTLWELTQGEMRSAIWQTVISSHQMKTPESVELEFKDGSAQITSPGGTWSSPVGWTVQQAAWTDLNHDGIPEVTLLVRRPFEPWPVDRVLPYGGRIQNHQDRNGQSSHIILIGWKKDHWGELWAGSALARPVRSFQSADLDQDGAQELVVLEGDYKDSDPFAAESLAIWKWNGFGFDLVSRLEQPARRFSIAVNEKRQAIILLQ